MAINLTKHRESLMTAWKDVLDDKTDTDWALFGYEGQTNDLKVVGTGDGGLLELAEDLNSGKIMYAFVKVDDPKTSLPKCVLINWQGDGANTVRKGICANHLHDVERLFCGANLTYNARNEDEVEPQLIIDKLSKSGSAYSFKAPRSSDNPDPTVPVGSNYQRVNPVKEINAKDRDQFWLREEQEEKRRQAEERDRLDRERKRLEDEQRQRELVEAERRDAETNQRNNSIDQIKMAEKMAMDKLAEQAAVKLGSFEDSHEVLQNQGDIAKKERNIEAQQLIAQRTIDARSIFERNTAAGQRKTPEKPVRASLLKAQQQDKKSEATTPTESNGADKMIEAQQSPLAVEQQEQASDDDSDQFATIKRSPKDVEKRNSASTVTSPTVEEQETMENTAVNSSIAAKQPPQDTILNKVEKMTEQQLVDEMLYGDMSDPGIQARALYDYQAVDETEITFDPGEVITNIEMVDDGWWQGLGPDGTYGLFPANYVELINYPKK